MANGTPTSYNQDTTLDPSLASFLKRTLATKPEERGKSPTIPLPTEALPQQPSSLGSSLSAPAPMNVTTRQGLAGMLKQFARGETKEKPEDLVALGATVGVSRKQLSDLYGKYRKEFNAESATSTQDRGPATPRLDRLAAMQGTPMGSVSIGAKGVQGATGGLARGSSPTGGTPIGGGMGVGASPFGTRSSAARRMNNIAGANLFRAEQERFQQQEQQNLENERIRAEIDAYIKANKPPEITKFENANEKVPYFLRR
jgi:hypothetical protein